MSSLLGSSDLHELISAFLQKYTTPKAAPRRAYCQFFISDENALMTTFLRTKAFVASRESLDPVPLEKAHLHFYDKMAGVRTRCNKAYRRHLEYLESSGKSEDPDEVPMQMFLPISVSLNAMEGVVRGDFSDVDEPHNHWVLVVIEPRERAIYLLDPLNHLETRIVLEEAFLGWLVNTDCFQRRVMPGWLGRSSVAWTFHHFTRAYQDDNLCGYYVAWYVSLLLRRYSFARILTHENNNDEGVRAWKTRMVDKTLRQYRKGKSSTA